jgi:hypothetical protein
MNVDNGYNPALVHPGDGQCSADAQTLEGLSCVGQFRFRRYIVDPQSLAGIHLRMDPLTEVADWHALADRRHTRGGPLIHYRWIIAAGINLSEADAISTDVTTQHCDCYLAC